MSDKDPPFSSQDLRQQLLTYPAAGKYLVGFSGGADSTALLCALHEQRAHFEAGIEAIHFNHGLQAESDSWQQHCERFCSARSIPLTCHALEMSGTMANLESRARQLRYRYLDAHIDEDTLYLTAHNADDRAETFLINALRGSGLDGLASIPEIRVLGQGYVARPLLEFSRASLEAWLTGKGIGWLEDPSNQDTAMDRNFIRLEVLPLLESRWPATRQTLARTARHVRTASAMLEKLVSRQARLDDYDELFLPMEALRSLGLDAAGLVLRAWLRRQGAPPLPEARLEEFLGQVASAASDAQCETAWSDWTLRLFREELHLLPPGESPECPRLDWNGRPSLDLGPQLGTLQVRGDIDAISGRWAVGPRQPGGTIRLHPDGPRRKLKKVFQELPIPPWQRGSIPVLYRDDEPVAVGDWLIASDFAAWLAESGLEYRWEPLNLELRQTRKRCHDVKAWRPA